MKKLILLLLTGLFAHSSIFAQTTEDFEGESTNQNTFTDNGQTFNILDNNIEQYDVFTLAGVGFNGTMNDDQFVDNSDFTDTGNPGTTFSVATNDATEFVVKSFYMFCSTNSLQPHTGTLVVTGKLLSMDQFTFTVSSFNSPFNTGLYNGFTLINVATAGASDFSNTPIDELEFSSTGNLDYMALDGFTWDFAPTLDVELRSFSAKPQNGNIILDWVTNAEVDFDHYELLHSTNGIDYKTIGIVNGQNNNDQVNLYSYTHENPGSGNHYYQLVMTGLSGEKDLSDIVVVNLGSMSDQPSIQLFSNPSPSGKIDLNYISDWFGQIEVSVFSAHGQIISQQTLQKQVGLIRPFDGIPALAPGTYILSVKEQNRISKEKFIVLK